jgi:hypothetical protein
MLSFYKFQQFFKIANRQTSESEQIMNLLLSEEATNFKASSIALASALKIELADGNQAE